MLGSFVTRNAAHSRSFHKQDVINCGENRTFVQNVTIAPGLHTYTTTKYKAGDQRAMYYKQRCPLAS